jgi:hypothetical protein
MMQLPQFIHKELELELRPEEIRIDIESQEERWAFRSVVNVFFNKQADILPV